MEDKGLISEFLSLVQVEGYAGAYDKDIIGDKYFGMPLKGIIGSERRLASKDERSIAYFSMEYGLGSSVYNKFITNRDVHSSNRRQEQEVFSNFRLADYFFTLKTDGLIDVPLYSGGLGVLAGDIIKTMADHKVSAVGIGMLWNSGYFRQKFWFKYGQMPERMHWDPFSYPGLIPLKNRIKVSFRTEDVTLRLWKYYVYSYRHDYAVPIILLDSDIDENNEKNRHLTDQLYRSDDVRIKIMQRVILGIGGIRALEDLNYDIDIFHLNEGHAVFAFIEKTKGLSENEKEALNKHFVYTCHTSVTAGHDKFLSEDVKKIVKEEDFDVAQGLGKDVNGAINLTVLSMNASSLINAVSKSHQEVMHIQFPQYKSRIEYVTNGVHPHTWISDTFMDVFGRFKDALGDVKADPTLLVKLKELRDNQQLRRELWDAHQANKAGLCRLLEKWNVKEDIFTICWARRVAAYKRPSMILRDVDTLLDISRRYGPMQIIFAGKAHPNDDLGFTFINEMLDKVDGLSDHYDILKVIMLENYEIPLGKILTSSVDVWLNNPLPPFEASGTSGMKAILNGVVQISTVDGWVREAAKKNIGRMFGSRYKKGTIGEEHDLHIEDDARDLYRVLEEMVSMYYKTNNKGNVDISSSWIDMMIDCISTGAEFTTYRMLEDYKRKVWRIA